MTRLTHALYVQSNCAVLYSMLGAAYRTNNRSQTRFEIGEQGTNDATGNKMAGIVHS